MFPAHLYQAWLHAVVDMNRVRIVMAALLLTCASVCLGDVNQVPLRATDSAEITLGRHLMMLEDPQGTLQLNDILLPDYQSRFEAVFVDTPYYGRSHSTYWFRLRLAFEKGDRPRLIEIAYPHLRNVTLYEQIGHGPFRETRSGYATERDSTVNPCLRFCFLIEDEPGIHTLYLRVNSDSPLFLPITLRTPERQVMSERISMGSASLFYGAFVVMALFNLFLYFSTQERSYLVYVLYIASLALWTSSHDGLLRELVLQHYGTHASYSTHFLLTLVPVLFGAAFCNTFLKTHETMPVYHKIFWFLIGVCLFNIALILITGRVVLPNSVNLVTVAMSIAGLSAGITGWMRGLKTARFFLTAWLAVIIGSLIWVLTLSGVLPFNPLTAHSVHVGALVETILLSLALGDRINELQAERIRIEQEAIRKLEESNQKLEASNKFKDEFLSTVSHELRTPMNGIVGAAELLEHTALDSEQYKYLSTINRSSRDMLAMVENILTYTQFEAGTAVVSSQAIKIRDLLDQMAAHYRGRASVQYLDFRYHLDPSIPDYVAGDADKLQLLLDHLLDNALKFTDSGQVRFDVSLDNQQESERALWLKFVIKDTGCGVPESLQKDIFDSFKQADGSMTRRKGGLGIGLALCKRIVTMLQGQLLFKSAVQQGTTVIVSLPFQPCVAVEDNRPDHLKPSINPANTDVLVVEDNYVNKLVLEGFLKKLGFNVFTADNGKEALTMLEKREFDLILMDCQMPVMDGFEATRQTRLLKNRNASTPIIAVTANANPGDRERCIAAGMNDYMKKPFSQATLVAAINRWLGYRTS